MSKTVDERVVEMRFDNKQFESNVQTSMSTIEKLKKSLDFRGAEKGLDNLNTASKNVNMSGLSAGVEAVQAKFSALQVIGVTALANITNSAVNSARRIVNAFTIQPITTGFNEYELKMGSVQTIMAATGESLETVNKYLEELNKYSDQTIYSFSDMTQNIGKFTNAGVKLEDAVMAIKGISNEAAVSGANANEASRAMYNFAQALSAGYVKLIDWKSIENANMATVEFKQQLIDSAVAMGTLIQRSDGMYQTLTGKTLNATYNFNDTLQEQWMTTDVLVSTLKMYADETTDIGKKAYASAQDVKTFSMMMDTLKEAAQSGWAQTWEIIWGDFEQGKQLWTELSNIFSGIIGAIDEVRNNFLRKSLQVKKTDIDSWNKLSKQVEASGVKLSDFQDELKATAREHGVDVDGMIEKNGSLEASLKENWLTGNMVVETLKRMATGTKQASKSQEEMTTKLKHFQDVVDKVWLGSYYNGEERVKALTEAGYDYAKVQDLVNKTVDGHRLTLEDLGEEQLKSIGYTEEEIKALKDLASQAEKSGTSLNDLINSLEKKSGRELLTESFTHLWEELQKIFDEIKKAWDKVFPKEDDGSDTWLYRMIQSFHDSVMAIEANGETLANVRDLFTGIYNALYLISALGKGPLGVLRMMWKVLKNLLQLDTLGLAARIGRLITAFKEWITKNNEITQSLLKAGNTIIDWVDDTTKAIVDWVNNFGEIKIAKDLVESFTNVCKRAWEGVKSWGGGFSKVFNELKEALGSLSEYDPEKVGAAIRAFFIGLWNQIMSLPGDIYNQFIGVGKNTVDGLNEGLKAGISGVIATITNIATSIIETIKAILGIHSPSTVMIAIGAFIIMGLIQGMSTSGEQIKEVSKSICATLTDLVPMVGDIFKSLASKVIEIIRKMNIDIQDIFVAGTIGTVLLLANKFIKVIGSFANPFKKLGNVFDSLDILIDSIDSNIRAKSLKTKAEAIKIFAEAIAILAAAIIGLSYANQDNLWSAVGVIFAVSAILGAMAAALVKFKELGTLKLGGLALVILSFGAAILLISWALKGLDDLGNGDLLRYLGALGALAAIVVAMGGLMWAMGKFLGDAKNEKALTQGRKTLTRMAISIGILVLVCKMIESMDANHLWSALIPMGMLIGGFALILAAMGKLGKENSSNIDKAAALIFKMAAAIAILIVVIKLINGITSDELGYAAGTITIIGLLFAGLIYVSKWGSKDLDRMSGALIKIAAAVGLMVLVVKLIAGIPDTELGKGMATILKFMGMMIVFVLLNRVITGLIKFGGADPGTMLMKVAAACALMGVAIRIIGSIKQEDIDKAIGVLWSLTIMFSVLTAFSGFTGEYADKAGTMMVKMAAAILILVGAIILLSLLKPEDVILGAAVVGGFLGLFYLIEKASSTVQDASKTILVMSACIAGLVLAIWLLSAFTDMTAIIKATACVMGLIGMMALLVASTKLAGPANTAIITITLVIMLLAGAIAALASLPNLDGAIKAAIGIGILLASISGSMLVLSFMKTGVTDAAVLAMAKIGLVVAELAIILGIMSALDVAPSLETCIGLSVLLLAMSGVTAILALVGPAAPAACEGAAALLLIATLLGASLVAIAELAKFASRSLPEIATNLSDFMANLQPFIEGATSIPSNLGAGIESLAKGMKALLGLTVSNFWDGILTFGQGDIASVGEKLVDFGVVMKEYAKSTEGLDHKKIEGSAKAADALIEVAKKLHDLPSLGEASITKWGTDMVAFGNSLKGYANSVGELTEEDITAINSSAAAAKSLVEVYKAFPTEGGAIQQATGSIDFSKFESVSGSIASGLVAYSSKISEGIDTEGISNSADAAKSLVEVVKAFPAEGGWIDKITGSADFSKFETFVGYIASGLVAYSSKIAEGIDVDLISRSAEGAKSLVDAISAFPKSNGWLDTIFGSAMDAETFKATVQNIAAAMVAYSNTIGTSFDAEIIESSAGSATKLVGIVNSVKDVKEEDAVGFKNAIDILASVNFEDFVTTFSTSLDGVTDGGAQVISNIISGMKEKEPDVKNAIAVIIDSIIEHIKNRYKDFNAKGAELIRELAAGIGSKLSTAKDSATSVCKECISAVEGYKDDFYTIGKNLVQGFANGISANTWIAEANSRAMANAAKSAAKRALNEHSPSKEMYKIGDYAGQGFVNALLDYASKAYVASYDMASEAKNGLSKAISRISDIIGSDIDTQPTIRPVVDLSEVTSGVNAINGMMTLNPSVGVMASVSSINASMNRRIQNGQNGDILNAIAGLNKTISNMSGDTYNVNGVTYDDGSNISEAVKAIIQAAKIDRRR